MIGQLDLAEREVHAQVSGALIAHAERFGPAFNWGQPLQHRPLDDAIDHRNLLQAELAAFDHYRPAKTKELA